MGDRAFDPKIVANGGVRIPAGAAAGLIATSDASGNISWAAGGGGPPTGAAGGDLVGTYPNPTIALLAVTDAKVAAANKDGLVGVASMRTLGAGALQAMPGNRTLDAITVAAADVSLNTHKLTNVVNPTAAQDAATKDYSDRRTDHPVVFVVGPTNISVSSAPASIAGVVMGAGQRALLVNQTTTAENGIWVYQGSGSAMTRPADYTGVLAANGHCVPVMVSVTATGTSQIWMGYATAGYTTAITVGATGTSWELISVPTVTSLPTTPANGQECYYVADATNGIVWHLKYRAASASAYRWEFVGGTALYVHTDLSGTIAVGTFGDLTANTQQITLPLAGDYEVEIGAEGMNAGANGGWVMSYKIGAAAATATQSMAVLSPNAGVGVWDERTMPLLAQTAATVLRSQFRAYAVTATVTITRHRIAARPIRVG